MLVNEREGVGLLSRVLDSKSVLGICILLLFAFSVARAAQSPLKTRSTASFAADRKANSKEFACLPKAVRADEVVSYGFKGKQNLTVEKKLIEMQARCRGGKLVDAKGREIRFFRVSCWGNPPDDYLEIRKRENEELATLKKHYTVIVFSCNPMIQ